MLIEVFNRNNTKNAYLNLIKFLKINYGGCVLTVGCMAWKPEVAFLHSSILDFGNLELDRLVSPPALE